jgi:hypothetical protein
MSKRLLAPAAVIIDADDAMLLVFDVFGAMAALILIIHAIIDWVTRQLLRIGANA